MREADPMLDAYADKKWAELQDTPLEYTITREQYADRMTGFVMENEKLIELLKEKLNNLEINENDFNRKKKVFIANAIVDFENAYQVNNEIRSSILKYNKILNDIPSSIENLKFDKFAKVKDNLGNETAYVILKPIKKEE